MILSFMAPKKHEFRMNPCLVLADNACIAAQKKNTRAADFMLITYLGSGTILARHGPHARVPRLC